MLLALRFMRVDRPVELYVSAFPDDGENPARLAAKVRVQQARRGHLATSGPRAASLQGHSSYSLHIASDAASIGDESSYYLNERGYVLHFAVFTHEPELAANVSSAIEHLQWHEPGDAPCRTGESSGQAFYGPALPTDLVESTIRSNPGSAIPSGDLSGRTFRSAALGVRVELPPHFQPIPTDEAYRVTELLRDPAADPESGDRRRALFRACSRVIFAATDPLAEITPLVNPGLAVVAVAKGCVPDLLPPGSAADHENAVEFATILARSLGVTLTTRGRLRSHPGGLLTSHLDGTLAYRVRGEDLLRRASLRVSATANGDWLILVYTVAPSPTAEREIESRIVFEKHTPAAHASK